MSPNITVLDESLRLGSRGYHPFDFYAVLAVGRSKHVGLDWLFTYPVMPDERTIVHFGVPAPRNLSSREVMRALNALGANIPQPRDYHWEIKASTPYPVAIEQYLPLDVTLIGTGSPSADKPQTVSFTERIVTKERVFGVRLFDKMCPGDGAFVSDRFFKPWIPGITVPSNNY